MHLGEIKNTSKALNFDSLNRNVIQFFDLEESNFYFEGTILKVENFIFFDKN